MKKKKKSIMNLNYLNAFRMCIHINFEYLNVCIVNKKNKFKAISLTENSVKLAPYWHFLKLSLF